MRESGTGDATVTLITPSFEGGGVERVMLNLANGMADAGLRVHMVALSARGPYRDQVDSRVEVTDLSASRLLWALPGLVRYLRSSRPEAVLSALDYINVGTLLANGWAGSPARAVVSTHKFFSVATRRSLLRRERWLLGPLMRLTYPRAHRVVAIADEMADDLAASIGLPRKDITVLPNAVVTREMLERAREPAEHPWLRDDGPPVLLGVGRLHEQKDFRTLLRAFALLREGRPARLVILGEGPERPALESTASELGIAEDVDLPGFVANPYAALAAARLFVMSSRYEGLPTVLIEAMACGCPVVSTDCPSGPAEILADGRYGPLVSVEDPEALAEGMEAALADPVPSEALRERADRYSVRRVVPRYREVLGV